jgi:hypothetical protein
MLSVQLYSKNKHHVGTESVKIHVKKKDTVLRNYKTES